MKKITLLFLVLSIFLLTSCNLSSNADEENNENIPTNNEQQTVVPDDQTPQNPDVDQTPQNPEEPEEDRWKGEIAIETSVFSSAKKVRLSSFSTGADDKQVIYLKQYAPYNDSYTFKTNSNTTLEIYSKTGVEIAVINPSSRQTIDFLQDEEILTVIKANRSNSDMGYNVSLKENYSLFPYDPINQVDAEALLAKDKKNSNLLSPTATISYKKREGGLYINCNNPEQITNQCLHNALTRNDVSNQSVFFTFEHNNSASTSSSRIDGSFYYGYQVINRSNEDVYITVKNIGLHIDGPGCWLGEKEWIDFYNTKFQVKGYSNYTSAQKTTFNDYYGFSNSYQDPDNQAITYRLPAGEYIYVMGGTSADAYNNTNVFNTADYPVAVSGCSNGAVLFEVAGDNVEGIFYAYQDINKIQPDNKTHQGYVVNYANDSHNYGRQYVGYDNCHGVVDAHLTWEFNDSSNSGNLKVNYQHPVASNVTTGKANAYKALNSTLEWSRGQTHWATHINPLGHSDAVGTDMTKYYTINSNGEQIVLDYDHLDGTGQLTNIGNWMIDYMEHYTFVNHGDKDRNITVGFDNNGCVAVLVRDQNGKLIEGTAQYTIVQKPTNGYAAIYDRFSYTVTVPANGYVQFVVEYNLLANASGYVKHFVELD